MTGKELMQFILNNDAENYEFNITNADLAGEPSPVSLSDLEVDPDEETVTINT